MLEEYGQDLDQLGEGDCVWVWSKTAAGELRPGVNGRGLVRGCHGLWLVSGLS